MLKGLAEEIRAYYKTIHGGRWTSYKADKDMWVDIFHSWNTKGDTTVHVNLVYNDNKDLVNALCVVKCGEDAVEFRVDGVIDFIAFGTHIKAINERREKLLSLCDTIEELEMLLDRAQCEYDTYHAEATLAIAALSNYM